MACKKLTCRAAAGWMSRACFAAALAMTASAALAQRTADSSGSAPARSSQVRSGQVRTASSQARPSRQTQATSGQAASGQAAAGQRGQTPADKALASMAPPALEPPFGPLTPEHQKYLDEILGFWEHRSSQIERYRCKFQRWEYDPVFGPKDPSIAKTYSLGVIKYAAPDKGLFKVEEKREYTPPAKAGEQGGYAPLAGDPGEHWVCDGVSVFEYDSRVKTLYQRELPPDMRGSAIVDGPLPFLFGAKVDKIKARYWLRVVTPKDAVGEYWIEAWPKSRFDAANFQRIEIILDEQDYLPKAIKVYDPRYDERSHPASSVYLFEEREVNWNTVLESIASFGREFHEPSTPRGWKKEVVKYQSPATEPAPAKRTAPAPTAQRPAKRTAPR